MLWLALIAVSVVPQPSVVSDRVDVLERHWFYDGEGRLVFQQLVGGDVQRDGSEAVCFWRLIKTESLIPQRDRERGGYYVLFIEDGPTRRVTAPAYRERWTQWDVELENREVFPKEK